MRKDLATGVGLAMFSILLLVVFAHDEQKKESKINDWVQKHGYEIVQMEKTYFDSGPFGSYEGDKIYRVLVKDRHNKEHVTWFRVGKSITQLWGN